MFGSLIFTLFVTKIRFCKFNTHFAPLLACKPTSILPFYFVVPPILHHSRSQHSIYFLVYIYFVSESIAIRVKEDELSLRMTIVPNKRIQVNRCQPYGCRRLPRRVRITTRVRIFSPYSLASPFGTYYSVYYKAHTHTRTHTHTHTHTQTHTQQTLACTTCSDFGFLFLTLFSQTVHVHERTHLCTYLP